ncbi:MAG TPA: amidohydrolase family protein, partial [Gemmatimonadaceae bacterium]|nr:amidohydrolase family protein [Gemmatimonadaceae bacterium]
GWEAFPDCRADIQRRPTEYLRHFYYDGVNFDPTAVRLAVDFAGADHVLAASDYPHQIGSIAKMKSSLAELRVSEEERKKIMGENARKLYRL